MFVSAGHLIASSKQRIMAKSLRAKSHLKAKSIKRKNEFQKTVDARAERVANKLKEDLIRQKLEELKNKNGGMELDPSSVDALEAKADTDAMDTDAKKVSTSGWRDARHHNYKKSKKMKAARKKGSFTKF